MGLMPVILQRPLDQCRQRREPDEELSQVMNAELLRVLKGVDPSPVDDFSFAHKQSDEIQPKDAEEVKECLPFPPLVEVAPARESARRETRLSEDFASKWVCDS